MKIKIIRQFGAAIAALLIFYGAAAGAYRSYETVLAAQVEIPPAIVVKQTSEAAETESVTPTVTASTATATSNTAAASTEVASTPAAESVPAATSAETAPVVVTTAPKQEETAAIVEAAPVAQEPVVTEPVPVVPSLSEFLAQFRCGGCGKNCSLLNPRCGVGTQKAQQAEAEYYATYS